MRFESVGETLLELAAKWFNLAPLPVADILGGMMTSRAIMAGHKLGLYQALGDGPATAALLAARLGYPERSIALLADALTSARYLRKRGAEYANSPWVRKWLLPDAPGYVGHYVDLNYDQWEWWSRLETLLQEGQKLDLHEQVTGAEEWRRYMYGLRDLAAIAAAEVAAKTPADRPPERLLDIAGGHGMFSVALCRRYPYLHATIFELAGAAAVGREIVAGEGLAERITYTIGDLRQADFTTLGPAFDAVYLFQIVHHLTPAENRDLLARARAALRPGGTLALVDSPRPPDAQKPDFSAFLALHFYLISRADTYTLEEMESWLHAAGLKEVRRQTIVKMPGMSMLSGRA